MYKADHYMWYMYVYLCVPPSFRSPICKLIVADDLWALMDALQEPVPEEVYQHLECTDLSNTPAMVRAAALNCSPSHALNVIAAQRVEPNSIFALHSSVQSRKINNCPTMRCMGFVHICDPTLKHLVLFF